MHLQQPHVHDHAHGAGDHAEAIPPCDILVLSAADSDLASLAEAAAARGDGALTLGLVNPLGLADAHDLDHFLHDTAAHARIVLLRQLGGPGYWRDGVEGLRSLARGGGPFLATVPGETTWNPDLEAYATVDAEDGRRLWRYLVEGGAENAGLCLAYLDHLIGHGERPAEPVLVPPAGFYLPRRGIVDADAVADVLDPATPVAALIFYKSVLTGGSLAAIDALADALDEKGLAAVPIFVDSLKSPASAAFTEAALTRFAPQVVVNTTAFALSKTGGNGAGTVLDRPDRPVLQAVLAGSRREVWEDSARGLLPRDLVMHVVLPELDGRLITRAVAFKEPDRDAPAGLRIARYHADRERCGFVAAQAAAWVRLGATAPDERNVAIVLSNYPDRDGRIANGVGLDSPASAVDVMGAMAAAGYGVEDPPTDSDALMTRLLAGRTNAGGTGGVAYDLDAYGQAFACLPTACREAVIERWGEATDDPAVQNGAFQLAVQRFGRVIVAIQPPRGYGVDPKSAYHDPALVPPHSYLAFYLWLREAFGAHAVVHLGKHGNLEWLPGKAAGLSATCWPEVALGPVPLVYPFIVNDPGEGSQAKRRSSAVIIDHLMPPMTRAEVHGGLARLETLVDEFYVADGIDIRRRDYLAEQILETARGERLDGDLDLRPDDMEGSLQAIDAHLCDLKEMQIRDGLHVFGASPTGRQRRDTLVAIARVPRSGTAGHTASLHRAIADDLDLGFDPLANEPAEPWEGPRPEMLSAVSDMPWRTTGDTVERIELLAAQLIETPDNATAMSETARVLGWIEAALAPSLDTSGAREIDGLLAALDGRFVAPGPAGAPTRGRADVLPSGRNFYSVDIRGIPTEAAWALGQAAAEALVRRYRDDHGAWPRVIAMTAWGTSNMRTGGDDIAHALALMGARPVWEAGTGRITGVAVTPLAELGRPRVDVTLRISGMFRDAFPEQVELLDAAVAAVAARDEDADANPLAANVAELSCRLQGSGLAPDAARRLAQSRIYGAKPGAYGAGLQALIDHGGWTDRRDFAEAFLAWGGFAYGDGREGTDAADLLSERLAAAEAVYQAQDNREHDILDSDDYYQFQGGLAATVEVLSGRPPPVYHGDTSRPEHPKVRSLDEEIARVVRGRATNPKWIAGAMRHGYKGAFEMAATVDYLFAFAATTEAVGDHHFDMLHAAYLDDERVRSFIERANPAALAEMAARFREAIDRQIWSPRSNSAYDRLTGLMEQFGQRT